MMLIHRNKIAIHAKHRTVMNHDMQLLRDLWKTIAPESAIGADSKDTREQKEFWQAREARLKARQVQAMRDRVQRARATGTLHKLTAGDKGFCRMHKINIL